jgi:hypothetical protein
MTDAPDREPKNPTDPLAGLVLDHNCECNVLDISGSLVHLDCPHAAGGKCTTKATWLVTEGHFRSYGPSASRDEYEEYDFICCEPCALWRQINYEGDIFRMERL